MEKSLLLNSLQLPQAGAKEKHFILHTIEGKIIRNNSN